MFSKLSVNENDLLRRVKKKKDLEPFFFRKIKGIRWFDPLQKNGYFSPINNKKPIQSEKGGFEIPNWPVLNYLVNTSEELSFPKNKEYIEKFLNIIRDITAYAKKNKYSNYLTWWQLSKTLKHIPSQYINIDDLVLIDYWLDDPFDKILIAEELGDKWLFILLDNADTHNTNLALKLIDKLYKIKPEKKNIGASNGITFFLRFDHHHARKLLINNERKLALICGEKIGIDAVKIFENKLIKIFQKKTNKDQWSSIWRNAIEEHEQNKYKSNVEDILLSGYRDSLLGFVDKDKNSSIRYLKKLFNRKYETFKRVAIYTINQRYGELIDIVDILIDDEFFSDQYRHEMWNFLYQHFQILSKEQKEKVFKIIEDIVINNKIEKDDKNQIAYKRSIWLSAIKDNDKKALKLYKKYIEITKIEPEHPDFSFYISSGWAGYESPISHNNLIELNTDELINTINSYKDYREFNKSDIEGLSRAFKEVIKTKADKFYLDLEKFIDCDLAYIYPIIESYNDLWKEKKQIPWNSIWPLLLDFCEKLIKKENFWNEENAEKRESFVANRHWIVKSISKLIENGTKHDEHAFDQKLLPIAKNILLFILERQKGEKFSKKSDAGIFAINSPRGCCLEALINHSLRKCRIADKGNDDHNKAWAEYEPIYNSELKKNEHNEYEFATLVTMYLPNFLYMSEKWIISNLSNIFNHNDYQKWLCAMQGYAYVRIIYSKVYKHLKENDDLIKALDDNNLKNIKEKIIQNIVLSFIWDYEKEENDGNKLISVLIKRNIYEELHHLIWFVWTLREKNINELTKKVFTLWPRLLENINLSTQEGRKIASSLCCWSIFVELVDDITENWLLKIAPYASEDYNGPILLKELARISEKQPLKVQNIWLKMLVSYNYDYPEESIRQIFNNLISLGSNGKRKSKEIVDAYLKHGIERPRIWLKDIENSTNIGE